MFNKVKYWILGCLTVLAFSGGLAIAASWTLPPLIHKGDLFVGGSDTQAIRLPTGSPGSVLIIDPSTKVPKYAATSTLGFTATGGSGATTSINSTIGPAFTFVAGTSGSSFNIATSTATVTFNLPKSDASHDGYLSQGDWTTFNNKGSGSVTSVDMTVPTGLAISGNPITTSGTLALALQAGYNIPLTASTTNWNGLYNNVLSRLTVATGTSGSAFNISTSTNSVTINLPNADASHSGQLTSTDWSTFNNKQATIAQGTNINVSGGNTINLNASILGETLFSGTTFNGTTSTFTNLNASSSILTNATTTGQMFFPTLLGKLLATDPNGMLVATSTAGGGGGVTSVTGSGNITSSGGATPNITLNSSILGITLFSGITLNGTTSNLTNLNASSTILTNATTTGQSFFSTILGKFLSTDSNGMLVATTTPLISLANGTNTTASGNAINLNSNVLGVTLFAGTTHNATTVNTTNLNATSSILTNATTTGQSFLPGILGKTLATDPNGMIVATTTPNLFVTAVTGSGNIASSGGLTPNITLNSSVLGITFFSGTTINASSSVITTATTTNLSVTSLTNGNCVQAGGGGLLTTTGSACGSGGNTLSTSTIQGMITGTAPITVTSGVVALTNPLAVQYGGTGQSILTANYLLYGNGTSGVSSSSALYYQNSTLNASTSFFTNLSAINSTSTNLVVTSLTNGNCVQAGGGGLLTTTGSACGSGGGTTLSTSTIQSMFQGGSFNIWSSGFQNASTSLFTSATTTNLGVLSLNSASPVRSTAAGTLFNGAIDLSSADASGILAAARFPALTGDITTSAGALGTTLATVNTNTGSFGDGTHIPNFTVNGKGLITAAGSTAVTIPVVSGASPQVAYFTASNTVNGNGNFTWVNGAATLAITGSTTVSNNLLIGTTTQWSVLNGDTAPTYITGSSTGALELVVQNLSNTATSSSEVVVTSNGGSDNKYFATLGINGNYSFDNNFTIASTTDAYLYASDGSLAVGTASSVATSRLKFFTGGPQASNERMSILQGGNVGINTTSPISRFSLVGNEVITGSSTITNLALALPVRSLATGALINGPINVNSSDVTGTLQPANGGTGATTLAAANIVTASAAASQVPYFTAATTQAGSANFLWLNGSNLLMINGTLNASTSNFSTLGVTGQTTLGNASGTNLSLTGTFGTTATSTLATTTISGVNVVGTFDKSFQLASTTVDTFNNSFSSATSTWQMWNPSYSVKLANVYCKTDVGTVWIWVGDGSASSTPLQCTSAGVNGVQSKTFNSGQDFTVQLYNQGSTPNRVRATFQIKAN